MSITQLVYISRAVRPMSEFELMEIIEVAERFNAEHRITGLLLYSAGNFMQLIEGKEDVIDTLFNRISQDARHTDVQPVWFAPARRRLCPNWNMGLLNLSEQISLDRTRLNNVIARIQENGSTGREGVESLSLLKHFRKELPAHQRTRLFYTQRAYA